MDNPTKSYIKHGLGFKLSRCLVRKQIVQLAQISLIIVHFKVPRFVKYLHFETLRHKMAIYLFYLLYQSNRLNITIAQWLQYRSSKPQIMSSNPHGDFVNFLRINFQTSQLFTKITLCFLPFDLHTSYPSCCLS